MTEIKFSGSGYTGDFRSEPPVFMVRAAWRWSGLKRALEIQLKDLKDGKKVDWIVLVLNKKADIDNANQSAQAWLTKRLLREKWKVTCQQPMEDASHGKLELWIQIQKR